MKNLISRLTLYVRNHKLTSGIIVLALIGGGYYAYANTRPATPAQYVLAMVTRGTVLSTVTGSGQISALDQLAVKPLGSGQVVEVDAVAGQQIAQGQTIAILDERSALTSIAQAKASLQSAQANYDSVMAGETGTSLAVDQASLAGAQLSLANTEQGLLTKISQTYTTANSDIVNKTFPLFTNPMTSNPQLYISGVNFNNAALQSEVDNELSQVETTLSQWKTEINTFSSATDPVAAANDAIANLKIMDTFFGNLATLFNSYALATNSSAQSSVTSTTIDNGNINSDKNTASSAQTDVESGISNLQTSIQSVQSSVSSLAQSQAAYNLKVAPPTALAAASAQSQLVSAQASLQAAYNTYNNNVISAPISGTLAEIAVHVGDQASSGTAAATIVTSQQVAIIPFNEVDVSKVKVGQKVTLTFDALPAITLTGKVAQVDPIGTVTQGVVNYNVTIALDTQNDQIKPNMSVSVSIITGISQDVLVVPNAAIQTANSLSYVGLATGIATSTPASPGASGAVYLDAAPVPTAVTTGLSNDTETEVDSGLKEGDVIVQQTIAGTAAAKTTTTSGLSLLGGGNRGFGGGGGGGAAARTTTTGK
jgi:HlyD family secretion protein